MGLVEAIGLGIVGGLILNVMPCVFPVLFFKLSGVIEHRNATARELRRDGFAYLLGTLVTFGGFAALIIALRASGDALGWGMQMQNAPFVAFLTALIFAFGLNALGVFELRFAVQGGGGSHGGFTASFFDGALITLISTPCSAPFLGGAATYALAGDTTWWQTLAVFWAVGFGLALPIVAIGIFPRLVRFLPRPGAWMETFKILTGFTLIGAAVWLFGVLQAQISPAAANDFLWFLLALAAVLYLLERNAQSAATAMRRNGVRAALVGVLVGVGLVFLEFEPPPEVTQKAEVTVASSVVDGELKWTPFTEEVKTLAMSMNRPVFVDFTADWCASCKVFEKTHILTDDMAQVFDETRILAAKADLTRSDDALWEELKRLGRSGLPAYVIYLPDGSYDLLPEGPPLTLADRLRASAKLYPPEAFKAAQPVARAGDSG